MSNNKSPLQAFIMSCLAAGWGLVYVGQVKWALRVAGLVYVAVIICGVCGWIASPLGLYALFVFIVLLKIGSAIAAALLARRDTGFATGPNVRFHMLYLGALIIFTTVLLGPLKMPLLGYQTYYIPSGSMAPTLAVGDYIVSDTRPDALKVGDIVVYNYKGIEAVKRVVALAGDTLAIVNGDLINDGESLGLFFAPPERAKMDYSLHLSPLKVKSGYVYLLGDNRDNSNDSRFIGQVPLEDIKGKVTGIWLSKNQSRMGTTF